MVDIYIAEIPFPCSDKEIFPASRKEAIERCKHPETKLQKYYVWKLLEYALEKSMNITLEESGLSRKDVGGWDCHACKISLSHSKKVVAVAVANTETGIDIETNDRTFSPELAGKILTPEEFLKYQGLLPEHKHEFMLKAWTQKEALFKKSNQKVFSPSKIQVTDKNIYSTTIMFDENKYMLSVATDNLDKISIITPFNNPL